MMTNGKQLRKVKTARPVTWLSFQILVRALREAEFRTDLFAEPEEALAGYLGRRICPRPFIL